ncbi:uncharacterized protein LOC131258288 isoform X3 [Magnolia sinica]|uniref:uncharacterized protein LOC131258288 isoform X3 n=1 Tax=Magnolia sinica TaxID=86752 RepID=UPI002658ACB2|nr:uncharacterized protein LOC131258288 isoform X3 [Magnolia sinica]
MAGNFRDLRLRCRFLFHPPSLSPFLSMGFCDFQPQKRCLETLAYEEIRASEKEEENVPSQSTALVLHGLLGSARNWRSFSRSLLSKIADSSSSTEWKMVLVDLRNHGRSAEIEGLDPPHDMVNAARDLANLVKFRGWSWPDVVIGHSMGGKVALQFAESCARGDYGESAALPKQLWVLDSVVGEVNPDDSDGEVEKVLKTLQSLPSSLPSRKEKSYWPLLEHPPEGLEISVVRAEGSDRWTPQVLQRLEGLAGKKHGSGKGKFLYRVLPNSGHWVHVDNPKGLLEIITPDIISIG